MRSPIPLFLVAVLASACTHPPCAGFSEHFEMCRAPSTETALATFEGEWSMQPRELAVTDEGVVLLDGEGALVSIADDGTLAARSSLPTGRKRFELEAVGTDAYFLEATTTDVEVHHYDLTTGVESVLATRPYVSTFTAPRLAVDAAAVFLAWCVPGCTLTRLDRTTSAVTNVPIPAGSIRGVLWVTPFDVLVAHYASPVFSLARWDPTTLVAKTSIVHPTSVASTDVPSTSLTFPVGQRVYYTLYQYPNGAASGNGELHVFLADLSTGATSELDVPPRPVIHAILGDEDEPYWFGYPHWRAGVTLARVDTSLNLVESVAFFNGSDSSGTGSVGYSAVRSSLYFMTRETHCRVGDSCSGSDVLSTTVLRRIIH